MTRKFGGGGRVLRVVLGFWAACLTVALAACSAPPKQKLGPVQETGSALSARPVEQVAWEAIAEGAAVIDVRTEAEFLEGHLPGAILIPYDQIESRRADLPSDKSRPIVLYCRSGRRSGIAKSSLEQMGYTNAINAGGYEDLMRARPNEAGRGQ